MENVGAVKELSKIASHLEARICELERNNMRHASWKNGSPTGVLSDVPRECKISHRLFGSAGTNLNNNGLNGRETLELVRGECV